MNTFEVIVEGDEVVAVRVDGVRYESALDLDDEFQQGWVSALLMTSPSPIQLSANAKPFPVEKVVAGVFLLVALITLSVAGITGLSAWNAMRQEISVRGRVVELVSRKDSAGNEAFYPRVEFVLPKGTKQSVQLAEGSWPAAHQPGDVVTVIYDRERPATARIDSASGSIARWIATIITGVLGVAFTVAALLVLTLFRTETSDDTSLVSQA
jgi:hypothetical protein